MTLIDRKTLLAIGLMLAGAGLAQAHEDDQPCTHAGNTPTENMLCLIELVQRGNPWEEYSKNIKDVTKGPVKYEYATLRNGDLRRLNWSTWNGGIRVMTEPYMRGDVLTSSIQQFRLGGTMWIWDTKDPVDDNCVYHLYYASTPDGIIPLSSNGCTKADDGGEGWIYRRFRK